MLYHVAGGFFRFLTPLIATERSDLTPYMQGKSAPAGETQETNLFKDPNLLKRFNDISGCPKKKRNACFP
jgi:hypothetical protein